MANRNSDAISRQYERTSGLRGLTDPLRVVIVAPRIQHLIGGQEVQADLLIRLWRNDPALHISYIASNPELPCWLQRIRYLRTLARFPLYVTRLIAGIRDVDVVHSFCTASYGFVISTVPAYCVSRLLRKKVLINYHSPFALAHLKSSYIARYILKSADRVLGPSPFVVDVFRDFGISAQAIPNLVDLSLFSYRSRRPLQPFLLCSRNLEPYCGIDMVVRAFAEIQKAFPEARLWILGEGSQEVDLRQLVGNLRLKGVEMTGRVARQHIGQFYNKADILINASRADNMPVSILEAFASGLPVVTTDAGGIPYIVQHEYTGLLSKTDDWQQLAANVIRLLQNPALAERLTENAYKQSLAYRWDAVREQWLSTYRELCPDGKTRAT